MPRPLPVCLNKTCPKYKTNDEVMVLKETPMEAVFGCRACGGVHVRTLDWRRGQQGLQYMQRGRPEYARERAFFFQGKNRIDRSH